MKYKTFSMFLILSSIGVQASDLYIQDQNVQPVTHWEQMRAYSGKIVAYTASGNMICGIYKLENYYFGYVEMQVDNWITETGQQQQAYNMCRLVIKNKLTRGCCGLTSRNLTEQSFQVRLATKDEKQIIKDLIRQDTVDFDCGMNTNIKPNSDIYKQIQQALNY